MRSALLVLLICYSGVQLAFGQWSKQSSPTSNALFDVSFISPVKGWAVGQNGTMLVTTNGGSGWLSLISPTSSNLNDINFVDTLRGLIVGDNNTIFSTTDGGASWSFEDDVQPFLAHYYGVKMVAAGSALKLCAVGGRSSTGLTLISGSSGFHAWNMQNAGFTGRLVGVDFAGENTGWSAGDGGIILNTTNGGRWWNQQQSGTAAGLNGVGFRDSQFGIVVGDSGAILKTTDGGESWREIRWGANLLLFSVKFTNDSTAYAVGVNATILRTTDRGEHWTKQAVIGDSTSVLEDIFFINQDEGWAVGHGGAIFHTANGGGLTSVPNDRGSVPGEYNLRQSYPNPFNPSSIIEYTLPRESRVRLTIFDALGREIATLVDGIEHPGNHSVRWSPEGQATGVYFCRLQAGSFTAVKKMLLAK
jgi:photosystem II stability/assembly factor-like uncharacterized protein